MAKVEPATSRTSRKNGKVPSVAGKGDFTRSHGKVTNDIIEHLRQEIVTGRLLKGSRLPNERQLAEQFEVSQPTIREALRALDIIGLVDVRHGSGAYVGGNVGYLLGSALQTLLQLERVGILEILDVREIIGRESARLAAKLATKSDIERMENDLHQLQTPKVNKPEEVIELIARFQESIAEATHNPLLCALDTFLITLLLQIQLRALRMRGVDYWRRRSAKFNDERVAIVKAIRGRRPDAAYAAMEVYLEHTRAVFRRDSGLTNTLLSEPQLVATVADIVLGLRRD